MSTKELIYMHVGMLLVLILKRPRNTRPYKYIHRKHSHGPCHHVHASTRWSDCYYVLKNSYGIGTYIYMYIYTCVYVYIYICMYVSAIHIIHRSCHLPTTTSISIWDTTWSTHIHVHIHTCVDTDVVSLTCRRLLLTIFETPFCMNTYISYILAEMGRHTWIMSLTYYHYTFRLGHHLEYIHTYAHA